MAAPRRPRPPADAYVLAALARIETRLSQLEAASGAFLIGWDAMARACGKSPRTLRDYRKWGFPALRWGSKLYSSVPLIQNWLLTIDLKRATGGLPPYRQRFAALGRRGPRPVGGEKTA
jgi:hypothetical protein